MNKGFFTLNENIITVKDSKVKMYYKYSAFQCNWYYKKKQRLFGGLGFDLQKKYIKTIFLPICFGDFNIKQFFLALIFDLRKASDLIRFLAIFRALLF